MADNNKLQENFDFVTANKEKLLNLYRNKFVLVYEKEVVGSFDTYESAAQAGVNTYGTDGQFLVYEMLDTEPINFVLHAHP